MSPIRSLFWIISYLSSIILLLLLTTPQVHALQFGGIADWELPNFLTTKIPNQEVISENPVIAVTEEEIEKIVNEVTKGRFDLGESDIKWIVYQVFEDIYTKDESGIIVIEFLSLDNSQIFYTLLSNIYFREIKKKYIDIILFNHVVALIWIDDNLDVKTHIFLKDKILEKVE